MYITNLNKAEKAEDYGRYCLIQWLNYQSRQKELARIEKEKDYILSLINKDKVSADKR